jgi:cytochrome c oxidase subunit I+III
VALRRVQADDQRGFIAGLGGALALAGAGMVIQVIDLAGVGFGWTESAYASIFHTLAGFVLAIAVAAMIMVTAALYWAVRGQYTSRRHANVANVARFWAAMVVMWVVGFATVYLGPYLT